MIIYAVYIIADDGNIILSEAFLPFETTPNEMLLDSLIVTLQGVASEMTNRKAEMKTLEIEGLSYHIRAFGLYRIVLVTSTENRPESIIQSIGLRFMKKFGNSIVNGFSNTENFSSFKTIIREEVTGESLVDESNALKPTKMLGTGEIFFLPHHLQATALIMITIKEGTIEEIANESKISKKIALDNIISLRDLGFIGIKSSNGEEKYFCAM